MTDDVSWMFHSLFCYSFLFSLSEIYLEKPDSIQFNKCNDKEEEDMGDRQRNATFIDLQHIDAFG